jgi:hypothetical protein
LQLRALDGDIGYNGQVWYNELSQGHKKDNRSNGQVQQRAVPGSDEILGLHLMYTIYTKVCGHPFKLVDLALSATPVADKCMKSSTQPCNLHRQTLAVEWPH